MMRHSAPFEEASEPGCRSILSKAADPLSRYKKKREFGETPEPEGEAKKGENKHRFVIQKHDAKQAGCFSGVVRVVTKNGPVSIRHLVSRRVETQVLSWNHRDKVLEWKPIIGWFQNGSTDEWLHIRAEGRKGFFVTPNHILYVLDGVFGVKKVLAKNLRKGDWLYTPGKSIFKSQFDFMIGSLLGDSSIIKRGAVFSYGQVRRALPSSASKEFGCQLELRKMAGSRQDFHYFRVRHPINRWLYRMFYKEKKIVPKNIGHFLTARALAVWFMDDGQWSPGRSYFGNRTGVRRAARVGRSKWAGQALFYTNGFSESCVKVLANVLKDKFGLTSIRSRPRRGEGEYFYLCLNSKKDNKKLFSLIAPYMDHEFQYKCPIPVGGAQWLSDKSEQMCLFPAQVTSVNNKEFLSGAGGNKTRVSRFDIEVQDNHNYFAGGCLVSNSHFDLRLENDEGAMSSWSIPKHKLPSGKEKLLAVKTEDHPVSYNEFEGTIPEGEYGAGEVEIHDSGTYEEIERSPTKIVFRLKGGKERGGYKLFRTDGKRWMIMTAKKEDMEKRAALLPLSARQTGYQ